MLVIVQSNQQTNLKPDQRTQEDQTLYPSVVSSQKQDIER